MSVLTSALIILVIVLGAILIVTLVSWPAWSPDLTPCDVFICSYIKDGVYVPPMPQDLSQLRRRIMEAAAVNHELLQNVWQEFDYRIEFCWISNGGHYRSPVRMTGTWSVSPSVDMLPLSRLDLPGYCITEFGNPWGTYELPVLQTVCNI
jgi:hypothetical protein